MPALWQASQRPMYVRTVWVDGFRHAILSHDDPYYLKLSAKKRRPHSSASTTNKHPKRNSSLSNRSESFQDSPQKLDLLGTSIPNPHRPSSSKEFQIEKLNLTNVEESDDELMVNATPQPLNEFDSSRSNYSTNSMRSLRMNSRTSRVDVKVNTELSDRVLQWLDLAGKVDLLAPENVDRMTQPRHSWPEIQRKNLAKSKTIADVRVKENKGNSPKGDSAKAQQNRAIDRHDFYVPTSANTIENYARQSRNAKNTPRGETVGKIKDVPDKKSKDSRLTVQETRQKMVTERNAVEKQYAELVSKKLLPDLGMGTKRQVHIFMPDVPKKLSSNVTSRNGSLISQKS